MSSAFGPTGRGASVTVSVRSGGLTRVVIVVLLCAASAVPSSAVALNVVVIDVPSAFGAVTMIDAMNGASDGESVPTGHVTTPPGTEPV